MRKNFNTDNKQVPVSLMQNNFVNSNTRTYKFKVLSRTKNQILNVGCKDLYKHSNQTQIWYLKSDKLQQLKSENYKECNKKKLAKTLKPKIKQSIFKRIALMREQ